MQKISNRKIKTISTEKALLQGLFLRHSVFVRSVTNISLYEAIIRPGCLFVKWKSVDNQKTALPRGLVRKAPSSLCHGARTSSGSPMTLPMGKRVKIKPRVYIDPLKPFALKLKAGQDSSATSLCQNYNIKKLVSQLILKK